MAWADGQEDYKMKNKQEVFKCCEMTFVDLPAKQRECFISPFQGVREGWATCVQPWSNLREAERNEPLSQEGLGLPNACRCFPIGAFYPGRSEEETLEFLLGQVTGNTARNGSSPKAPRIWTETLSPHLK